MEVPRLKSAYSISNRNVRIVAEYVKEKTGTYGNLFDDLPLPNDVYESPDQFFLDEDEWTTYENFSLILRRAKDLVKESNFYFRCGASTARLRSWGRFHYFTRIFKTPDDGIMRLPFFNKNFNDTKEVEIIRPPSYDRRVRMNKAIIKVENHIDIDPDKDYIRDPYLQGIISSIPTLWGLPPTLINRKLNPYNPEVLLNDEPEFNRYSFDAKIEGERLTIKNPIGNERITVGRKIILIPEEINGAPYFLGKFVDSRKGSAFIHGKEMEAILITEDIEADGELLFKKGEIFKAPYFVFEVFYGRLLLRSRLSQIFKFKLPQEEPDAALSETINQLRKSMMEKNRAYEALKKTNTELRVAKERLNEYATDLENRVRERTRELRSAQQELLKINRELESRVNSQVVKLERYNELRRYLSPKLTEKILSGSGSFGAKPRRKMMTVVFSDVRGFSGITDSLESEEIFFLLNNYISEMIKIAHKYEGTLNKIIGDGLLIFFGDPIEIKDHAESAVLMAVDMQKKASELLPQWQEYGHDLGIGIGINTGFVTVGNIGSEMHRDYTVIGNQVNLASRLESMSGAGQILISHRTKSLIKDLVEVEDMGEANVKGIHGPVKVYSVLWR
jgi:class 3 adenylate cyclase